MVKLSRSCHGDLVKVFPGGLRVMFSLHANGGWLGCKKAVSVLARYQEQLTTCIIIACEDLENLQ